MLRTLHICLIGIFALVLISCNSDHDAQESTKETLNDLFTKLNEEGRFNGNVLVADKGQTIFRGSFGRVSPGSDETLNSDSVFEIASISKTLTAVAAHQLVEKGMLNYDDSIVKFFPELPYQSVTIKGLLGHTSGLFDVYEDLTLREQFYEFYGESDVPYSNKDYLNYLIKFKPPLSAEPNEVFQYSNTGYVLLGLIIEQVTKQPFIDYLKANVFSVAGMENTTLFDDTLVKSNPKFVPGYEWTEDQQFTQFPDYDNPPVRRGVTFGDDEIVSTLDDLLAFDKALKSGRLLKPDTLSKIYMPVKLNDGTNSKFGLAFFIDEIGEHTYFQHSGGTGGYRSYLQFDNDADDQTIIILMNFAGGNYQLWPIVIEVQKILQTKQT